MQILKVRTENVKGVKFVEFYPKKVATVIGGKNRQGKSSILDSIAMALGGKKLCPKNPIRKGQVHGEIEIDLEACDAKMLPACTVRRTFDTQPDGSIKSVLTITSKDGFEAASPQTVLDDLVGALGWDPEKFLRMDSDKQAEVLRELVNLDFTELDEQYDKLFKERTGVNAKGKELAAQLKAAPVYQGVPTEEVSVAELMEELKRRQAINDSNTKARRRVDSENANVMARQTAVATYARNIEQLEQQLVRAKTELEAARQDLEVAVASRDEVRKAAEALKDEDTEAISKEISDSGDINAKVRANKKREELDVQVKAEREKHADLTKRLEGILAEKERQQKEAKWPVEGLGYDANGVTYNGRQFAQASASEQRRVAVAIGVACNPNMRFMLIKDGSLLDQDAMIELATLAGEAGFQLFIERVGTEDANIVIEDGYIVDADDGMIPV